MQARTKLVSKPRAQAGGSSSLALAGRSLAALLLSLPLHAEVLDRIAVTVDKQVIAESDILRFLRAGALIDGKPVDLSASAKRAAAASLVDHALMMMDAADSHFVLPSAEDEEPLLQEVKGHYPNDAAFIDALKEYHITRQDLVDHLVAGARDLRFETLRFSPEVQISDSDLHAGYDKLAAEWRASHTEPPPSFEESRAGVEKVITGERTSQLRDQWLETARMEKHVDYREAAFQ